MPTERKRCNDFSEAQGRELREKKDRQRKDLHSEKGFYAVMIESLAFVCVFELQLRRLRGRRGWEPEGDKPLGGHA
jgi:hypothetical protein